MHTYYYKELLVVALITEGEKERERLSWVTATKKLTSNCHLNKKRRLDSREQKKKKQGRHEAKKESAKSVRAANPESLKRREKSQPEVQKKKTSSEDNDQQKRGIEPKNLTKF